MALTRAQVEALNEMCPAAKRAGLGDIVSTEASEIIDESVDEDALAESVAGPGLAGGAGSPLSVKVDDTTIEIAEDTLQVKAEGLDTSHLAADAGIVADQLAATVTYRVPLTDFVRGDLTAAPGARAIGFGAVDGVVVKAGFALGNTGADDTDDLSLEMDVKIGGVSIFDTKPKLTKAAADGADTFNAGTGVTVGVIDTDHDDVADSDQISVEYTLTRETPDDEMADLTAWVEIAYKVGV